MNETNEELVPEQDAHWEILISKYFTDLLLKV